MLQKKVSKYSKFGKHVTFIKADGIAVGDNLEIRKLGEHQTEALTKEEILKIIDTRIEEMVAGKRGF